MLSKEERKQLYRTDLKEYKRLKDIEYRQDKSERINYLARLAYDKKKDTIERKKKRSEINRRYREKHKKL